MLRQRAGRAAGADALVGTAPAADPKLHAKLTYVIAVCVSPVKGTPWDLEFFSLWQISMYAMYYVEEVNTGLTLPEWQRVKSTIEPLKPHLVGPC